MGDVADLLMPKLGLTMTEGTVARWLVAPGQRFSAGDIIVVVETDKIANDVEAPASGEVTALLSAEGDVVPVGTPIAQWRLEGVDPTSRTASDVAARPAVEEISKKTPQHAAAPPFSREPTERIIATPYARRLAREAALELANITGSGPRGRIKGDDILRAKNAPPVAQQLAHITPTVAPATHATAPRAAHSFAIADVDVSSLRALDARLKGSGGRAFERLTYMALACTKALAGDDDVRLRMGFETDDGLAAVECSPRDTLSIMAARIAQATAASDGGDLAIFIVSGRARLLVPSIPSGWRMALGVGGVRELRGGDASHEMTLAISYNSRAIDHASAARILDGIVALLEEPLLLLAI